MNTLEPVWFLKLESNRIFKTEERGAIEAYNAASRWLEYHTRQFPSYQSPRVWIVFSKERGGYVFRPNLDYVPSKNDNWRCVMELDEPEKAGAK